MTELESVIRSMEALGHRVTPSRVAVIAAVLGQTGHFSVDDLGRQARGVGRATVFRTVRLLTELDIVCRVLLEDGSLRYRVSRHGHHHHLVCVACGRVQDLDECAVGDLVRELAANTEYTIEGHWLEFYGRCAECRSGTLAGVR
ncbi:MAG: Fur family transcriptional regulator [Dehalococcoidia bacterium]